MLAGTLVTEDMKKDVKDLSKVANYSGDGELEARSLIRIAYSRVLHEKDYVSSIKEDCEHRLGVLEITGENPIEREIADKILYLMTRYENKQLLIVLESALRLIHNRNIERCE